MILRKLASDTRAKDFRLEIKAKINLILGRINHEKTKILGTALIGALLFSGCAQIAYTDGKASQIKKAML